MSDQITTLQYLEFFVPWLLSTTIAVVGMYAHLKYPKESMLHALAMALPFAWADWVFMTISMNVNDKYKILTPTQDTMFLIITQYTVLLILNKLYLKQKVTWSDLAALPIMLIGFAISNFHLVSKLFGIKIDPKKKSVRT
jgi:hypothetical protein